jgi:hypothetical protein
MAIKYSLTAKSGQYKDAQGNLKNSYVRCGVVMNGKNDGEYVIKLEALPVNFDGWIYMNKPEPKGQGGQRRPQARPQQSEGFDDSLDDVPF